MNTPAPKVDLPFHWLAKHLTLIGLAVSLVIGTFLRVFQLSNLPPGITTLAASVALQAHNLAQLGRFATPSSTNWFAPLWVWLQALSIAAFGQNQIALLVWPALLGSLTVLTTWLWLKSWFNTPVAWFGSFLMAVTPWAIALARTGEIFVIYPLLVTLALYTATLAWRQLNVGNAASLSLVLIAASLSGPMGWLIMMGLIITGVIFALRTKHRPQSGLASLIVIVGGIIAIATLVIVLFASNKNLSQLGNLLGAEGGLPSYLGALVSTLLMFNSAGDSRYAYNLSGSPELNVFVGLMFIAGLLISIARVHERKYRVFLTLAIIMLIPAVLSVSTAPDAAHAATALPMVIALAAIGISFMLELWYKTFPINSAARTTGQAAMALLLLLSMLEGYTQYFHAWSASAGTYVEFNEAATQLATNLVATTASVHTSRMAIAATYQFPVIQYLASGKASYRLITAAQFAKLPKVSGAAQFWITADASDATIKTLKANYPGAVLQPHYSSFNQSQLYYTYEVAK